MFTRTSYQHRYKLLLIALLAFSLVGAAGRQAAASPAAQEQQDPLEEVTLENGYVISFIGVEYDEGEDASTWTYHVEELDYAQDLSNWVLELPFCVDVLDAFPEPWEIVHPDPNAQLSGIKWETGDGFEAGEFWVSVAGEWNMGETEVAAKGPDMAYGTLPGPTCEQNRAPVAVDDDVATYVNRAIAIPVLRNDYDPDGNALNLDDFDAASTAGGMITLEDNGTLDASDDYLLYTPLTDYEGEDSFAYTVGDGSLTDVGTVSIEVLALDEAPTVNPPIANPDGFVFRDPPYTVPGPGLLLNDQVLDYVPVVIVLEDMPESGEVILEEDGGFTYIPEGETYGEVTFTYRLEVEVDEVTYTSTPATVTLNLLDEVKPTINWARPVPKGKKLNVKQDDVVELEVEATDNHSVKRVEFFRWNAATKEYLTVAEVDSAPYAAEIEAGELNQGFNQVYAAAYDAADNRSEVEHIWLFKEVGSRIFLPATGK